MLRELENDLWEAMVKPARKVRIGNKLIFNKNISCDVIDNTVSGGRVLRFEYNVNNLYSFIDKEEAKLIENEKNLISVKNPISQNMSVMRLSLIHI